MATLHLLHRKKGYFELTVDQTPDEIWEQMIGRSDNFNNSYYSMTNRDFIFVTDGEKKLIVAKKSISYID